ncbi:MAG: hypothetical protein QW607_00045 [Desulfurococcaceae archaeon]
MYELNKELTSKLNTILNKLENISKEKPLYIDIFNELSRLNNELSRLKTPLVYTRELLEKYFELYLKINEANRILDNRSNYITEELVMQLNDIMDYLDKYISILKKNYIREKIVFNLPIYTALVISILNTVVYLIYGRTLLASSLALTPILVIISLLLNNKNLFTISYIILCITAIVSIVSIIIYGLKDQYSQYDYYNIILYLLIILTSISYVNASRFIKSKTSSDKLVDFINNFIKKTSSKWELIREESIKLKELEEKAIELYRKLYGNDGEKLFKYKINLLLMHGYKIDEALRKTISQISSETN